MSLSHLFLPFSCRGLELANRIVLAPMTRSRAGKERIPNALMAEYYAQRSSAGLLITEATTISEEANGWSESPGIYTDAMTLGWKPVVEAIHQKGSRVFLQLWHMGRASHSSFHDGELSVAPSAIAINQEYIHTPLGKMPHEVPRALATAEIPRIVEDYRKGAERAKQAGFDGVEVHGANGYLIDQFLQSKTNHRDDAYGGSVEKRTRFLLEILDAIQTVYASDRIGVRLSPNGMFNDMGSPDYREQFTYVAAQLEKRNLGYLHVMDGLAFGFHGLGDPMTLADFRAVFHGPLIANCGYAAETAEQAVAEGLADLVAIGRPFISNPDLVQRWKQGWPLAADAPMEDWYTPSGAKGYVDYPNYQAT